MAVLLGTLAVASGAVGPHEAVTVTRSAAPVLAFLVGITVVADLAEEAQVFDVAAVRAARLAGGSTRRLFLLICALGTVVTVVLSLDTTAVLLTPVVLAVAQRLELRPLPFALAAVWLANTASLLLPVSNLTNLLAQQRLDLPTPRFAATMLLPEAAAVGVTVAVLLVRFRTDLRGSYLPPEPLRPAEPVLFVVATAVCLALGPFFAVGLPVAAVAGAGAVLLAGTYVVRRPAALRPGLIPWRLVLLVEGLFLAVQGAGRWIDPLLGAAAGRSGGAAGVLRTAGVGALGSNLVNNLPAYFALQRVTSTRPQLLGLLLGVNLGPLVLLWGSLATLLWRERCRARGVTVTAGEFARLGLVGVPLLLLSAWAALVLGPGV